MFGNRGVITERTKLLAEQAVALRAEGKTAREIASLLGISRSYACALYLDPDRTKDRARKDSYSAPCPSCGEPMSGSNGPGHPPERCATCAAADPPRVWTPERVIEEFQRFAAAVGRPPTASDVVALSPSQAVRLSEERLTEAASLREHTQRLPYPTLVRTFFGSWRDGVISAGLTPGGTGGPTHRSRYRRRTLTPFAQRVLLALRDGPATYDEICQRVGHPIDRHVLKALTDRELVSRVRTGGRGGGPFLYTLSAGSDTLKELETVPDNRWIVFRIYEQPLPRGESAMVFSPQGEVSAPTRDLALERVATEPGDDWYAVPVRFMEPMKLAPVEKLSVVREPPPG